MPAGAVRGHVAKLHDGRPRWRCPLPRCTYYTKLEDPSGVNVHLKRRHKVDTECKGAPKPKVGEVDPTDDSLNVLIKTCFPDLDMTRVDILTKAPSVSEVIAERGEMHELWAVPDWSEAENELDADFLGAEALSFVGEICTPWGKRERPIERKDSYSSSQLLPQRVDPTDSGDMCLMRNLCCRWLP